MGLKLMVSPSWSTAVRCLMGGILIRERRMLVRYRSVSRRSRCVEPGRHPWRDIQVEEVANLEIHGYIDRPNDQDE
jgi:hypothetical protein